MVAACGLRLKVMVVANVYLFVVNTGCGYWLWLTVVVNSHG